MMWTATMMMCAVGLLAAMPTAPVAPVHPVRCLLIALRAGAFGMMTIRTVALQAIAVQIGETAAVPVRVSEKSACLLADRHASVLHKILRVGETTAATM
jgi:hypothetical protein